MKVIAFLLILLPVVLCAQNKLSITVEGVKSSNGKISVAVYNKSEGFLKRDKVYKSGSTRALKGTTHIDIHDLPHGKYALAILHDENGNDKMDTNWLGIPLESVGFSRARMKTFGPPSFDDCAFMIVADSEMLVIL